MSNEGKNKNVRHDAKTDTVIIAWQKWRLRRSKPNKHYERKCNSSASCLLEDY